MQDHEHKLDADLDTPILGAKSMAEVISRNERETFYLIKTKQLDIPLPPTTVRRRRRRRRDTSGHAFRPQKRVEVAVVRDTWAAGASQLFFLPEAYRDKIARSHARILR